MIETSRLCTFYLSKAERMEGEGAYAVHAPILKWLDFFLLKIQSKLISFWPQNQIEPENGLLS